MNFFRLDIIVLIIIHMFLLLWVILPLLFTSFHFASILLSFHKIIVFFLYVHLISILKNISILLLLVQLFISFSSCLMFLFSIPSFLSCPSFGPFPLTQIFHRCSRLLLLLRHPCSLPFRFSLPNFI